MLNEKQADAFKNADDTKRAAIKKLLASVYGKLDQFDLASLHRAISQTIEVAETVRQRPNEQDLTKELRTALQDLRKICELRANILDNLEISKVNFQTEDAKRN
jgi:DNA-binding protein